MQSRTFSKTLRLLVGVFANLAVFCKPCLESHFQVTLIWLSILFRVSDFSSFGVKGLNFTLTRYAHFKFFWPSRTIVIDWHNLDSDFVLKWRQRFFFTINKKYETQKAYRKTKICFSYQKSIGLSGVSCYLCQYSLFSEPLAKKVTGKCENSQKKHFSEN